MSLNLNFKKISKYFIIEENTNIEKTHLWQIYLRIFSIIIATVLPIFSVSIFLFLDNIHPEKTKSYAIEAISYTSNIVFSTIFYSIAYICIISSKIKKEINLTKDSRERKKIVDSSFLVLMTTTLIILSMFIILSLIYSLIRAQRLGEHHLISKFILNYMEVMIPIIFFNIISNFFINISYTIEKIKSKYLALILYPICAIEILFIYIFKQHIFISNIIVTLTIPTLITSFIKMIIFALIYSWKIEYLQTTFKNEGNIKLFIFSKNYYLDLIKRCKITFFFSISYLSAIIFQSILINYSYSINSKFKYLFTKEGHYIILFVKIILYDLIYLLFLFSRTFNVSLIEKDFSNLKTIQEKIARRSFLRKIYITIIVFIFLISSIIYFQLQNINNALFKNLNWYYNDYIISNNSYNNWQIAKLINKFSQEGFLYGLISFLFVEFSVINRNIITRTDKRNDKATIIMIILFFISISLFSYIFAFVLGNIFVGLNGYFFAFLVYGLMSLISIFSLDYVRTFKLYKNNNLIELNLSFWKYIIKKWNIDFSIKNKSNLKLKIIDLAFFILCWIIIISLISTMMFA